MNAAGLLADEARLEEDLWAAERSTIVIDKEGSITHIQKNPIPEARDHSLITEAVKATL